MGRSEGLDYSLKPSRAQVWSAWALSQPRWHTGRKRSSRAVLTCRRSPLANRTAGERRRSKESGTRVPTKDTLQKNDPTSFLFVRCIIVQICRIKIIVILILVILWQSGQSAITSSKDSYQEDGHMSFPLPATRVLHHLCIGLICSMIACVSVYSLFTICHVM